MGKPKKEKELTYAGLEPKLREMLIRGRVVADDVDVIKKLATIVARKHFASYQESEEDLIQEGLLGVCELVSDGNFDPTRPALPFCFQKCRNCMNNVATKRRFPTFTDLEMEDNRTAHADPVSVEFLMDEIKETLEALQADEQIKSMVLRFFGDKFGIPTKLEERTPLTPIQFRDYDFLTSYVEIVIVQRHTSTSVLTHDLRNVLQAIEWADETDRHAFFRLIDAVGMEAVIQIFYLLAGMNIKFPTKDKLRQTDLYLSIYRDALRSDADVAASKYRKSRTTVQSIVRRFDKVFSPKSAVNDFTSGE